MESHLKEPLRQLRDVLGIIDQVTNLNLRMAILTVPTFSKALPEARLPAGAL
jgi:hypothetical protein